MSEWKTVRLGDLCDTISVTYKDAAEKVVLVNTSDVLEGKCLNHKFVDNKNLKGQFKKSFQKDDILYSEIRPQNKRFAYIDFEPKDYIASTKLMVLRSTEKVRSRYLYQLLKSESIINELQALAESRSGTFPQITYTELSLLEVCLPNLEEQDRIISVLQSLDDKIENNRKINENLEVQAQALFKSWFIDFEPFKDGKFIDSELGRPIPEGWRVGRLEEICEIVGGGTPSKSRLDYYSERAIAWLTPKDLSNHPTKFTSRGENDITQIGYENSSAKLMPKGSVLFSSRAPIGYITIAENDICTNQGFKSAVPGIAGTSFLYCFLKHSVPEIESKATGTTFKEASGSLMKSLPVIIPTDGIFHEFEKLLAPIFYAQQVKESETKYLAKLRDTLLPKLMSGEIKV